MGLSAAEGVEQQRAYEVANGHHPDDSSVLVGDGQVTDGVIEHL